MRTGLVTPHLSWGELACKDASRTPYPREWVHRAARLGGVFEAIRAACGGKPIAILSAYRTPEHNRRVGGAKGSQHVQGRALDLRPPQGMSVEDFHRVICAVADQINCIRGIGLYRRQGFVHVDIRPSDRLVQWEG